MTKKCSKCDEEQHVDNFCKNSGNKDGLNGRCRSCVKEYKNLNKKRSTEYSKQYYKTNKEDQNKKCKRYHRENKEAANERCRQYYKDNKEAISKRTRQYQKDNKERIAEYQRQYERERKANDPLFRLTHNIRNLIRCSLSNGGYSKTSKTAEILGCSFDEYYQHIEAQFTDGMSWERMSEIHIDHRLPVSAATTEDELLALNHHRNLQPLWSADNLAKSDSYCPKELEAYFAKHL